MNGIEMLDEDEGITTPDGMASRRARQASSPPADAPIAITPATGPPEVSFSPDETREKGWLELMDAISGILHTF